MGLQNSEVQEFTSLLASKTSVPGGGGASALVGAVGIALGDMVGEYTVGKKKYADVEDQVKELMEQAQALRVELLNLIDADAEAFAPLAEAYGIPKDQPGRDEIMEKALHNACAVPMDILRLSAKAIDIIEGFEKMGSVIVISDAGCGALCCKAALQGASLNVFINTKLMKDREYAESMEKEAGELLAEYCPKADAIFESVAKRVR